MKKHARVVVIGGGVVGCSVLYHLTKLGWYDVVLCERKELTAGSSWHAAGGFHSLNSDPGVARLQSYTIGLYREIEKLSGRDVGLHFTGGLSIAATPQRWEMLKSDAARHAVLGLQTRLVTPDEVAALCPLMDVTGIQGAVFDPLEGHLDPSGATHAFAAAARINGAEIYRHVRVVELKGSGRGTWLVCTDQGQIEAEHVVNAAGLWAREVGQLVGVHLPLIPMEHHYLITEDVPEIVKARQEMPLVVDLDGEIYLRQERNGVLLGVYEPDATPWSVNGTPWDYGETDLLPPRLDRLTHSLEKGFRRFPSLNSVGIRRTVNGPFTFTPDGNPLVGPVPGVPNFWAACGVMAGFAQGGGVGLSLAQWIVQGEPDTEILAMDVARFGSYATPAYVKERASEFYARRFQIAYPNEYWPAGRPASTSPLYQTMLQGGAVFGVSYGLEVPLFFADPRGPRAETPTLRRSNAFVPVGEEVRRARSSVALFDFSFLGKYEFSGSGARTALDRILAGRLPPIGRCRLTPMLTPKGRLLGDLTTLCVAEDRFLVTGSGYLQKFHLRWFDEQLKGRDVTVRNVSASSRALSIAGPRSREVLAALGIGAEDRNLPFLANRLIEIDGVDVLLVRISVTGELGFELHVPDGILLDVYRRASSAAEAVNGGPAGTYALNSLRLEKSYGIWSREFSRDYTPVESGLDRLVAYDKLAFIGRDAALRDRERTPRRRLVGLKLDDGDADASGYEPIYAGKTLVGFVTSGGFGHSLGSSLAMGYVDTSQAIPGTDMSVVVAGAHRTCRVFTDAPYDATGSRMRTAG